MQKVHEENSERHEEDNVNKTASDSEEESEKPSDNEHDCDGEEHL